ncbi:hypothetical protein I552_6860 [Mycobacterium xenopi 3993]|nr:hypothetical protein I552_6860 [Mycobacterium xenopi 3993]
MAITKTPKMRAVPCAPRSCPGRLVMFSQAELWDSRPTAHGFAEARS